MLENAPLTQNWGAKITCRASGAGTPARLGSQPCPSPRDTGQWADPIPTPTAFKPSLRHPAPLAHNPHPPHPPPRSSLGLVQIQVPQSGGGKFTPRDHWDPTGSRISGFSEGTGMGAPSLRTPPMPLVHPRAVLGQLHLRAPQSSPRCPQHMPVFVVPLRALLSRPQTQPHLLPLPACSFQGGSGTSSTPCRAMGTESGWTPGTTGLLTCPPPSPWASSCPGSDF